MTKGYALTIGLNAVDPEKYEGWSGDLNACETDAEDMAAIAESKGYEVKTLLTGKATRENVTAELTKAAEELEPEDIFLLFYSGHGGWIPDINGDEEDQNDETWCLYDGEMIDDELKAYYAKFAEGVRVIVFSDSCHSGSVLKGDIVRSYREGSPFTSRVKGIPEAKAMDVYLKNQDFYDGIQKDTPQVSEGDIVASVLLISGCQDFQQSRDGDPNSLFTSKLKTVWNEGKFKGNYKTFYNKIKKSMPSFQTPNYYWGGEKDKKFEKQKALTI